MKKAVEEDEAGNLEKALTLYMAALNYFQTHLKYEKNPQAYQAIKVKVRAEILATPTDTFLFSAPDDLFVCRPANSADTTVVTDPIKQCIIANFRTYG